MNDNSHPAGELFSRVYLDRGPPTRESQKLCLRLDGYIQTQHLKDVRRLRTFLQRESGVAGIENVYAPFSELAKTSFADVLDAITVTYRFVGEGIGSLFRQRASEWHAFVKRALREENVGYTIDDACGVRFMVDDEFERNRVSTLRAIDGKRYGAVREAFERSHRCMNDLPQDTKGAARASFEALEILAKLMVTGATRLDSDLVKGELTKCVSATATEDTERRVVSKVMLGFADWVDGVHFYRHGQGTAEPVAPPAELAVFLLSSGASYLRLLARADATVTSTD